MNEYRVFVNWLFDGNINSPIPKPDLEYNIPDILRCDSLITHVYLISIFIKCGKLNKYLNEYLNNYNLYYIDKSELFLFIKECVVKNNIKRYQLHYSVYNRKNKLFYVLREVLPYLKNDDILLICEQIEKSDEKEQIYDSFKINKFKKEKLKKNKKIKKITLNDFLNNFQIIEVE